MVWVGYPESNEIEMTSVHGISVFGGTFPAEIWHSVYANGEVPCETFDEPEKPIVWAPFYGRFTRGGPTGELDRRSGPRRGRRTAGTGRGRRL